MDQYIDERHVDIVINRWAVFCMITNLFNIFVVVQCTVLYTPKQYKTVWQIWMNKVGYGRVSILHPVVIYI